MTCIKFQRALAALLMMAGMLSFSAARAQKTYFADTSLTFKDGIYFSFEDLKANKPSLPLSVLKDDNGKSITEVRPQHIHTYFEKNGRTDLKKLKEIYAFVVGGHLFVVPRNYGRRFADFRNVGALSIGFAAIYVPQQIGTERREILETVLFLLDWETGIVTEHYYSATFEKIEKNDKELFELTNDKRKLVDRAGENKIDRYLFDFIERYNERHPITIPQ